MKDHIDEGFDAFMSLVPDNAMIVCESNSLRKFVKPGVFIMAKNVNESQIKRSAMEVIKQADLIFKNDLKTDLANVVTKY